MYPDERFLTPRMVAERLRVTPRTVRNWIAEGRLCALRVGPREWRVEQLELERFIRFGRPRRGEAE